MDPDACLSRFISHCLDSICARRSGSLKEALRSRDEAVDVASDLSEWIARGGFEPDWREHIWGLLSRLPEDE